MAVAADYYLARSLATLRSQVNARWPGRDKTSDGWIGDTAHASRGSTSDHNPSPPDGVVRALDLDKDGLDPMLVVLAAIAHPATNYVIYAGSIWSRAYGFRRRAYTGANRHDKHVHVSITHTSAAERSPAGWLGGMPTETTQVVSGGRIPVTAGPPPTKPNRQPPEDDVPLTNDEIERIAIRAADHVWARRLPGWNGDVQAHLRLAGADQRANEMAAKVAELHTAGYIAAIARAVAHEVWVATKVRVAHLDPARDGNELDMLTALGRAAAVVPNLIRDTLLRVRHPEPGHDGEAQNINVGTAISRATEATELRQVGVVGKRPPAQAAQAAAEEQ